MRTYRPSLPGARRRGDSRNVIEDRVDEAAIDQQRLAGGRDMIVAAIAGLLFLIFSVLILRFIGVTLFRGTPGF